MRTSELAKILGPDERSKLIGDIAAYQEPSFVLKALAEWMTKKTQKEEYWYALAAELRNQAYDAEGRGL